MNIKTSVFCLLAILALISCDDNTGSIGSSIIPGEDILSVHDSTYYATSTTIISDRQLLARGSDCYLGKFSDEETSDTMVADFITQVGCTEDFQFPDSVYGLSRFHYPKEIEEQMQGQKSLRANLRLYISEYIGDRENAMGIEVWPLTKTLDNNSRYYSDIDPEEFYDASGEPLSRVTASVTDYVTSDSIRAKTTGYINSIYLSLPDSIAINILNTYYAEGGKEKFKNTPAFIDNICKGFYVKCYHGDGTMMRISKVALEIHFFHTEVQNDTTKLRSSYAEFLGNSEVMQVTHFENRNIENLLDETRFTYILTPYGVNTEMTLPIDDIIGNTDNIINSASLVMKALVPFTGKYALGIPNTLLLIRKSELKEFFDELSTADNITSYSSTLNTTYNEYQFNNISRLIMRCSNERLEWISDMGLELNDESKALYATEFPDWNKVTLIPVEPVKDVANNVVYMTIDQTPKCVRLCGGNLGVQTAIKIIKTEF